MKIIGAGFGRTGTMSLRAALEQIGYGPCYHMLEVFKHPGHIKVWQAAANGEKIQWKEFLGDYRAGVDYPLAGFYPDLMATFPDVKVILTVRDPEKWYASTIETIYKGTAIPDWLLRFLPPYKGMKRMVETTIWDGIFDGRFEDKAYAIQVFEEWIANTKQVVPPDKLLVYSVKDGWGPLCAFLDVPIPETPFPHINDRKTTQRLYLTARLVAGFMLIGFTALVAWVIRLML